MQFKCKVFLVFICISWCVIIVRRPMITRRKQTTSGTTILACDLPQPCTQLPPPPRQSRKSRRLQKPTKTSAGESLCTWILQRSSTTPGSWRPRATRWAKNRHFPQRKQVLFFTRHFSAPAGAFTPSAITLRQPSTRWFKPWCIHWARSERKRRAACPPNSNPSPCSTWTTTESSPTGSAMRTWLLRNAAVDELKLFTGATILYLLILVQVSIFNVFYNFCAKCLWWITRWILKIWVVNHFKRFIFKISTHLHI